MKWLNENERKDLNEMKIGSDCASLEEMVRNVKVDAYRLRREKAYLERTIQEVAVWKAEIKQSKLNIKAKLIAISELEVA